jgi:hypothetical protein
MPYEAPAAAGAPVVTNSSTSTANSPRISIGWTAPASFGGSALSYYQLQQSTDGATWSTVVNTSVTSYAIAKPAAGARVYFRVVAFTSAGLNSVSAVTSAAF